MKIIARIHTDFPQKFGIPRQSGLVPELRGRIVFEPEYAREEAVRGLDGFSHIWLLWEFQDVDRIPASEEDPTAPDQAARESGPANTAWSPMVRPPLLGGNRRMGVFATRSPFRPNAIGLSSVELERVEITPQGPVLHVRGADLRDNTPIYDIKPYLPATDCHPNATAGFTEEQPWQRLKVEIPADLLARVPEDCRDALRAVLAEDPRPARQRTHEGKEYTLAFANLDVTFMVRGTTLTVSAIR